MTKFFIKFWFLVNFISESKQIGGGPMQVGGTKSISGQIEEMERDGGSTCAAASHMPLSRPNKR